MPAFGDIGPDLTETMRRFLANLTGHFFGFLDPDFFVGISVIHYLVDKKKLDQKLSRQSGVVWRRSLLITRCPPNIAETWRVNLSTQQNFSPRDCID
jgi:hypothetical protein